MKKRLISILIASCMMLSGRPATALAATCPFDRPDGFAGVWGTIIKDGYRFKEAGEKKMVVCPGDYETTDTMYVSQ